MRNLAIWSEKKWNSSEFIYGLAPAMNIQRSPLCGRNFEYYSEDPVVSGRIAAAITNGVQKHKGCGTTIKHFALNNQETNRMASNSIVSERALREIYLRNFEICIRESAPAAVMSSYNLVNGEHANNSKDIQTYVLRDEWGYDGAVMTDWYAVGGMMSAAGGRTDKHPAGLASGCIHAGNDLVMPGMEADFEEMLSAVDNTGSKISDHQSRTSSDCEASIGNDLQIRGVNEAGVRFTGKYNFVAK